jgi:hypothetical protein
MGWDVATIRPGFVAEIGGLDLSCPMAPADMAALWEASDAHAVLVFRDQTLTDAQQIAFTASLGKIELNTANNVTRSEERRLGYEMSDISNLDKDGKLLERDDRRRASTSATACGIRIPRSRRRARNIRCCPPASSRRPAATPSSPTCAPLMTRSIRKPRPKSKISSPSIRCCSRGASSAFPSSARRSG